MPSPKRYCELVYASKSTEVSSDDLEIDHNDQNNVV